jgi:hypothetical protein
MIRSVESLPHTSTLSNCSISPLHEEKKIRAYTSPNCFVFLYLIDTSDDTVFDVAPSSYYSTTAYSPFSTDHVEPISSSIYTSNIVNIFAFMNWIVKIITPTGIHVMFLTSHFIVWPNGSDNLNTIAEHLMRTIVSVHNLRSSSMRPFRIVPETSFLNFIYSWTD